MITDQMLESLKNEVYMLLSKRRFSHTLGVEKAAEFLAEHCLPDKIQEIKAAAILHDVTKELSKEEQERIVLENGIGVDINEESFSSVVHSYTAPVFVKRNFPQFATEQILSAIENHTLGNENMTVFDKIIFLADFIEETRTYPESAMTAKFVYDSMKHGDIQWNISILNKACIMEIDSTINSLIKRKTPIHKRTILTKASLISKN